MATSGGINLEWPHWWSCHSKRKTQDPLLNNSIVWTNSGVLARNGEPRVSIFLENLTHLWTRLLRTVELFYYPNHICWIYSSSEDAILSENCAPHVGDLLTQKPFSDGIGIQEGGEDSWGTLKCDVVSRRDQEKAVKGLFLRPRGVHAQRV